MIKTRKDKGLIASLKPTVDVGQTTFPRASYFDVQDSSIELEGYATDTLQDAHALPGPDRIATCFVLRR